MKKIKILTAFLLVVSWISFAASRPSQSLSSWSRPLPSLPAGQLDIFFEKNEVTLAVIDSGLGGLSIMAEAAAALKKAGIFKKVNLVFFNALFSNESGYNSLKTRKEKILIFNSALHSLTRNFHPDLILIGCNTLSVLYEDTLFSKETKIPVLGIIEPGLRLLAQSLKETPGSLALIFGTETTISEGEHKKRLLKQGIEEERIVTEACPELASYIEKNYKSEETELLISAYVEEALAKIPELKRPIYISLNCTHYGYALPSWQKAFESRGLKPLAILNPNLVMLTFLWQPEYLSRFKSTKIQTRVVSMVEISREKIESLGDWLGKISPEIAASLAHYELKQNLFEWQKYVTSRKAD